MAKIIRATYPLELSLGLLLLLFVLSFFLSPQVFVVSWHELMEGTDVYFGMVLVSLAVIIMVLILWEEFLFPIKVKPSDNGMVFRNHRTKLKTQLLIYCMIPAIFIFIYFKYDVSLIRFIIWATICIVLPIAAKLGPGINNYNDFLKLTNDSIAYKNNKEEGTFELKSIQHITLVRDERGVLHKFQIMAANGTENIIDLDEMELEAFIDSIDKFMTSHYGNLLKDTGIISKS
jgi:hypothetical protein